MKMIDQSVMELRRRETRYRLALAFIICSTALAIAFRAFDAALEAHRLNIEFEMKHDENRPRKMWEKDPEND